MAAATVVLVGSLAGIIRRPSPSSSPLPIEAAPPERPAAGVLVPPGAALQQWIDAAGPGEVLCLSAGAYPGPIVIRRPLTLWGPREAVIQSSARDSTVTVRTDKARLLGFTVDGSGNRPEKLDAAVLVVGNDIELRGLRVRHALFGLVVDTSSNVAVVGNDIEGDPKVPLGLRGDGIRLWETKQSIVDGNRVSHCRDILLQYSPNNKVVDNVVTSGRYGTHFMYSSDAVVRGNRYLGNTVGVFVMYSKNIELTENLLGGAVDHGGMGIGVKESGNLVFRKNNVVQNHTGIYLDNSPFHPRETIRVEENLIALNQTGIEFLASTHRSTFRRNDFRGNQEQVRVDGGGDARHVDWDENHFDDYRGYDLDRDGFGDIPYESRSYASQLISQRPELAFFRGSAAIGLVEAMGRVFPLFQPRPILIDSRPRRNAIEQ